jgi:hypothetical protein
MRIRCRKRAQNAFHEGQNQERMLSLGSITGATHHRPTPLHSPACVSTHPLPVLSTVHVGVLRGVPCLGHGLFVVTDGGRYRKKHLKGEHCSEQPSR